MAEMQKLIVLLAKANIPFEITIHYDSLQVWYPSKKDVVCDAICHSFSYGHEQGLLEIMGLVDEEKVGDSVEGWLTAKEVFCRIFKHYYGTL